VISGNVTIMDNTFVIGDSDVVIEAVWGDASDRMFLASLAVLTVISSVYCFTGRRSSEKERRKEDMTKYK
jgi:hypothetical protein